MWKKPPPQTPEEKANMEKPHIAQLCPHNLQLIPDK